MMSFIKNLASSSNLLFIAAILLGIFLPQAASVTFFLILPALTVILTVTLLRFPRGFFQEPKKLVPATLLGNLMNYIILGNIIILGSVFLIRDEKIWIGMVLIASMPPAVAVLSLSEKLRADKLLTFAGFAGTYAAAFILAPLIGVAFLKYIPISYEKLIVLALALIGLPLTLSRIAVDRNWDAQINNRTGIITDLCFFIVFYSLTAGNAGLIKQWPFEIPLISGIALLSIVLVHATFFFIRKFNIIPDQNISSLLLLGTMKNYGLAGGIALYVFQNEAALPALIFSIFMFLYSVWLKFTFRHVSISTPSASQRESSSYSDPAHI